MASEKVTGRTMPRFIAIDGLRAWLAWIVVATHIVQQALPDAGGPVWIGLDLGGEAVSAFIIISGFVIAHLLIERPVTYISYIIPRFTRLFPAFSVCCLIGGICYAAGARWAEADWFDRTHGYQYLATIHFLPQQIAAHLTMLHGIFPNTFLPLSEYAFSPPGWSVSLEWQFYLVAPLAIRACKSRAGAVFLVVTVALFTLFYHWELKPLWDRPSFLPGSAKFFLLGIASRFAAPVLAGSVTYVAATGLGLGLLFLWFGSPAIAIWVIVYSFMMHGRNTHGTFDRNYVHLMRATFESRIVNFLAERSYSTYLLHWSVIMTIGIIATRSGIPPGWHLLVFMILTVPLTVMLQEPIYRWVELPGRAWGKRWAMGFGAKPLREISVETVSGSF